MPITGGNLVIVGYEKNDLYQYIIEQYENYGEMSRKLKININTCYNLVSHKHPYKNMIYEVVDTLGKEERERIKKEYLLKKQNN